MAPPVGGLWFTIPEISKNSGIPETTLRRWAKWSRHYLEHKKVKNKRLYSKKAVDILLLIRDLYAQGKNREEILTLLEKEPPPGTIDTPTVAGYENPMESIIERNTQALHATAHAIKILGSQQQKIDALENEIEELKKEMTIRDQKNEKDKMELLQEINAMMLEMVKQMKGKS